MGSDEDRALEMVDIFERILFDGSAQCGGEVVNFYGDGCLSIFPSVTSATECARRIQLAFSQQYEIPVRIGLHLGEVLIKKENAYGDSVNVASRIESLGQPGAVLLSEDVVRRLGAQSDMEFEKLDDFEFKNVPLPLGVYALRAEGLRIPDRSTMTGKLKPGSSEDISIVVLPFENLSRREDEAYIVEGIADEIRSQLMSIESLRVISRSSSASYQSGNYNLDQLVTDLNVGHILEGRVQFAGDQLKINVELIDVHKKEQVWTSPGHTRKIEDVFEIQNRIARSVIDELKMYLSNNARQNLEKVPTKSLKAYELYQNGMSRIHKGNGVLQELDQAVQSFRQAIAIDPSYAKAYLGLAWTYLNHIFWGRSPASKVLDEATAAALQACDLDDSNGEVFGMLGAIEFHKLNLRSAERYLLRAVDLNPNYVVSCESLAMVNIYKQDHEEAVKWFLHATAVDPLSLTYSASAAHSFYYNGLYDEGLEFLKKPLSENPMEPWLLFMKGMLLSGKGEYDQAIDTFTQRETGGKNTNWMLAYSMAKSGRSDEVNDILEFHLSKRKFSYVPPYMIATIYAGLGDDDNAIKWLAEDLKDGGTGLFFVNLHHDPKFTHLKGRAEFQGFLDTIK